MATPSGKCKEPKEISPQKKGGKKAKQVRCLTCEKDVGELFSVSGVRNGNTGLVQTLILMNMMF